MDSTWYITSINEISSSFFTTSHLLELDMNGILQAEHDFFVPGNEIMFLERIRTHGDTLLLAGVTSPGCDFGPYTGMLTAWYNGNVLWNRIYYNADTTDAEISMIQDMVVGDSTILLTDGNVLLFTDHTGHVHERIVLPWGAAKHVGISPGGYFVAGNNGLLLLNEAADTLGIWNNDPIIDVITNTNNSFLLLTSNELLELDPNLQPSGYQSPLSADDDADVHLLLNGTMVVTGDSAFIFNETLEPLGNFSLQEHDGFYRHRSKVYGELLMTVGTFTSGATGAACRTISTTGELPADVPELELLSLVLDSISYSLYEPTPGLVAFTSSASFEVELGNNGVDTIRTAVLNSIIPYGICSYSGTRIELNALDLPPGGSATLTAGPFQLFEYHYGTDSIEASLCIWATSPNDRLDQDRSNDRACVSIPIILQIPEGMQGLRSTLYPNPFTDWIMISPPVSKDAIVELLDVSGRYLRTLSELEGATHSELYIPDLVPGTYILSIIDRDQRWVHKLVRQ